MKDKHQGKELLLLKWIAKSDSPFTIYPPSVYAKFAQKKRLKISIENSTAKRFKTISFWKDLLTSDLWSIDVFFPSLLSMHFKQSYSVCTSKRWSSWNDFCLFFHQIANWMWINFEKCWWINRFAWRIFNISNKFTKSRRH